MSKTYDFIDIDICSDCMMWHANGVLPDGGIEDEVNAKSFEAIINAPGIDDGYDVIPGSGDNAADGYFSHQPCDACRRPFGGQRYPAVMMQQLPVPADRIEAP